MQRREVFERYHFIGFMQVPIDMDIDFGTWTCTYMNL